MPTNLRGRLGTAQLGVAWKSPVFLKRNMHVILTDMEPERTLARFMVGYFGGMFFILLFVYFIFLGSDFAGGLWLQYVIILIYSLVLYSFWGRPKLILKIAAMLVFSMFSFIAVFVITMPVSFLVGPICFIYAYKTGLMKKSPVQDIVLE